MRTFDETSRRGPPAAPEHRIGVGFGIRSVGPSPECRQLSGESLVRRWYGAHGAPGLVDRVSGAAPRLALRRVRVSAPLVHVDVDVVALEHETGETVAPHYVCDGVEAFEGTPLAAPPPSLMGWPAWERSRQVMP